MFHFIENVKTIYKICIGYDKLNPNQTISGLQQYHSKVIVSDKSLNMCKSYERRLVTMGKCELKV